MRTVDIDLGALIRCPKAVALKSYCLSEFPGKTLKMNNADSRAQPRGFCWAQGSVFLANTPKCDADVGVRGPPLGAVGGAVDSRRVERLGWQVRDPEGQWEGHQGAGVSVFLGK